MIVVYTADAKVLLEADKKAAALAGLPAGIQASITAYRNPEALAVRLGGRLLLRKAACACGEDADSLLRGLSYGPHGRPFFGHSPLHFSIAYSSLQVWVAVTSRGRAGIDAEQVRPLPLAHLSDYFTSREWASVQAAADKDRQLLHLWTRKEAVLKATGAGMTGRMNGIEVLEDQIMLDNCLWQFISLGYDPAFCVHLATDAAAPGYRLVQCDMNEECV